MIALRLNYFATLVALVVLNNKCYLLHVNANFVKLIPLVIMLGKTYDHLSWPLPTIKAITGITSLIPTYMEAQIWMQLWHLFNSELTSH